MKKTLKAVTSVFSFLFLKSAYHLEIPLTPEKELGTNLGFIFHVRMLVTNLHGRSD